MKKISKVSLMAVGVVTLFTTIASAASTYGNVSTGRVSYADLNKTGSITAKATTHFIPLNGYNNYRSYVYLAAENNSGATISAKNGYGKGNGTVSNPDVSTISFSQNTVYSWVSTHRSEGISDYHSLWIKN